METRQKLTLDLTSINSFPTSTTCNHKNYDRINICDLIAECDVLYNYKINEVFTNAHENTNFPSILDPWSTRSRFCKYERGLSKIS